MTFHQRFQLRVEELMREGFLFGSAVVQARVEMVYDYRDVNPQWLWRWEFTRRKAA